ncbi:MAG: pyridoxamine 5'-phosphate oxidase [Candidatus Methylacidiphilales bacterium]
MEHLPPPDSLRKEYRQKILRRSDLLPCPVAQFRLWFHEACSAQLTEPNAMTLACADSDHFVSARTVLLKAFDERGFVFFTNYSSRKSIALDQQPRAALLFPWLELERQVEINGRAEKISTAETLAYFTSRPFGSRIGAWVSRQSSVISSRSLLEEQFESMMRKFKEGSVPLPDFWGGWRVVPEEIEFWQGGQNRLHDRFRYKRQSDHTWTIQRLSP